jgi:hypothetical protein
MSDSEVGAPSPETSPANLPDMELNAVVIVLSNNRTFFVPTWIASELKDNGGCSALRRIAI